MNYDPVYYEPVYYEPISASVCSGDCEDCGKHFEHSYFTSPPTIRCEECGTIIYLLNQMKW
jgi:hypothetical protein